MFPWKHANDCRLCWMLIFIYVKFHYFGWNIIIWWCIGRKSNRQVHAQSHNHITFLSKFAMMVALAFDRKCTHYNLMMEKKYNKNQMKIDITVNRHLSIIYKHLTLMGDFYLHQEYARADITAKVKIFLI